MAKYEEKPCKCGSHYIENRTHWQCRECSYFRIHGETQIEANLRKEKPKKVKVYQFKRKAVKSSPKTREKRKELLNKDREFYFYQFSTKEHECEECRLNGIYTPLPDEFEDEDGNINGIGQYSHILGKGAFPEHRHHKLNMNRLCLQHHHEWEFSSKEDMKIFEPNQLLIDKIRKGQ